MASLSSVPAGANHHQLSAISVIEMQITQVRSDLETQAGTVDFYTLTRIQEKLSTSMLTLGQLLSLDPALPGSEANSATRQYSNKLTRVYGEIEELGEEVEALMLSLRLSPEPVRPDLSDLERKEESAPAAARRDPSENERKEVRLASASPAVPLLRRYAPNAGTVRIPQRGLRNTGVSCPINAALTLIYSSPELTALMQNNAMSRNYNAHLLNIISGLDTGVDFTKNDLETYIKEWIDLNPTRAQFRNGQQSVTEFIDAIFSTQLFPSAQFQPGQSPILHFIQHLHIPGMPEPDYTNLFLVLRNNPYIPNPTFGDNLHNALEARPLQFTPSVLAFKYERPYMYPDQFELTSDNPFSFPYTPLEFREVTVEDVQALYVDIGLDPSDELVKESILQDIARTNVIYNQIKGAMNNAQDCLATACIRSYTNDFKNHITIKINNIYLDVNRTLEGGSTALEHMTQAQFDDVKNAISAEFPNQGRLVRMRCSRAAPVLAGTFNLFRPDFTFDIPADLTMDQRMATYEVKQVIAQYGGDREGHFVTLIRGNNGWTLINDERVTPLTNEKAFLLAQNGVAFIAHKLVNGPAGDGGPA